MIKMFIKNLLGIIIYDIFCRELNIYSFFSSLFSSLISSVSSLIACCSSIWLNMASNAALKLSYLDSKISRRALALSICF